MYFGTIKTQAAVFFKVKPVVFSAFGCNYSEEDIPACGAVNFFH